MADRTGPAPIVLLVEDDQDSRDMYVLGLQLSGLHAEAAASGHEALAVLDRVRPAVVVTDLSLPDMDGLLLCQQLAEDPHTRDIPRIVLTGRTTDAAWETRLASSCRRVLQKPCAPDELATIITEVLTSS